MTTENIVPEIQPEIKPETPSEQGKAGSGCLGQLGWFLSGAVLPIASLSFYRKAAQRSVGSAILFFIVFTLVLSTLSTLNFAVGAFAFMGEIQQAYLDGEIPEITISKGVAEVNSPQPMILLNGADQAGRTMFVAIDTTGVIEEIDPSRYDQGFLLTRNEFHLLTDRQGYQTLPLSEFNKAFEKDPIILNGETVSQGWGVVSAFTTLVVLISLILWHTVVRLMFISMIALIFWGVISLIKPNTGFGPIIITGLYAVVPSVYLSHLFSRSDLGFPGEQTFFLLVFWVIGLLANFLNTSFLTRERPLYLLSAFVGLPMLLFYMIDIFWQFESPYDRIALWLISGLTLLILIGLRLFFRFREQNVTPPVSAEPPALA